MKRRTKYGRVDERKMQPLYLLMWIVLAGVVVVLALRALGVLG